MKTFRRPVTAAAVALGLTAALVAMPATAADIYYPDLELGTEDASSDRGYPDDIWFTGQSTTGTQTQTEDGLVVTGRTMLLYGADEIPLTGASFIELVQSISVDADGPWSLQLPIYYDNNTPGFFTTLRPATNNTTPGELDSLWITSGASGNYAAGDQLTLQQIADEIDEADSFGDFNPSLLAYGILVDTGWEDTTIRSFTFNGDTHFFTPEPDEVEDEEEDLPDDGTGDEDEEAPPATPVEGEATFTG